MMKYSLSLSLVLLFSGICNAQLMDRVKALEDATAANSKRLDKVEERLTKLESNAPNKVSEEKVTSNLPVVSSNVQTLVYNGQIYYQGSDGIYRSTNTTPTYSVSPSGNYSYPTGNYSYPNYSGYDASGSSSCANGQCSSSGSRSVGIFRRR